MNWQIEINLRTRPTDSWWEAAALLREPSLMLCRDLDGWGGKAEGHPPWLVHVNA